MYLGLLFELKQKHTYPQDVCKSLTKILQRLPNNFDRLRAIRDNPNNREYENFSKYQIMWSIVYNCSILAIS